MNKLTFISGVLISLHCQYSLGKVAPDFIHVCPGLKSDCLLKNFQETLPIFVKGIPSLDIEVLDPIHSEKEEVFLPGLKIELNDGYIQGLKKCVFDHIEYNPHKVEFDVNLHCNITIKGKYKASGMVLIIAINGEGDAKLSATNVKLKAKIKFEDNVRNGTVYFEIKHINANYEFTDRVHFDISNLFKGNPQISEAVLNFLNANWKVVTEEFGRPIVDKIIERVIMNMKKFFKAVPKDELFVF